MIFITQLKFALKEENSYQKEIKEFDFVKIQNDIINSNVYEVERIVAKRTIYTERDRNRQFHEKWRVKYLKWKNNVNEWKILNELHCSDLLREFEKNKFKAIYFYQYEEIVVNDDVIL